MHEMLNVLGGGAASEYEQIAFFAQMDRVRLLVRAVLALRLALAREDRDEPSALPVPLALDQSKSTMAQPSVEAGSVNPVSLHLPCLPK